VTHARAAYAFGTLGAPHRAFRMNAPTFEAKICAPADFAARAAGLARPLVFTNGVFDILHRGHVTYLSRAKALGDELFVGVNSDASVRALKGPERPINRLEDRLSVLEALSCVDHVIPFDTATPEALIAAIRPDVFVKGGDYRREMLPEAPLVEQLGGTVRILSYVEDYSTTGLIQRMRVTPGEPSAGAAGVWHR
jgi:D-beta-D-heptose 7-phosphate kinase / D-beta-D-heptose 1-phosphate adenosyltransferase